MARHLKALTRSFLGCYLVSYLSVSLAQDTSLDTIHRIKTEAFSHSQVMDTLRTMTEVYGPRLTASPEFDAAAEWAMGELKKSGISNVHEEAWGPFGRSWSLQGYTLEMLAPQHAPLYAVPLAWSSSLPATETSDLVYAPVISSPRFDIREMKADFEKYKAQWTGKLKDKVVLTVEPRMPKPSKEPVFRRYTEADLADIAKAPDPAILSKIPFKDLEYPTDPDDASKFFESLTPLQLDQLMVEYFSMQDAAAAFYRREGVKAIVKTDRRAHDGKLVGEAAGSQRACEPHAVPTFVITEEQYARVIHLLKDKQTVKLRLALSAKISDGDVDGHNIIGEIPGTKKPDEVVMIGAHFDSWHSATGATDNGAGSAVMLEVMRVLKTLNLPMDRTVRIGLWSGEEQGIYGSKAYVAAHFGDPKTGAVKPEQAKLDAYLNLDNGSGKIRGIYLEGNDAARPKFQAWFTPFADLGVSTLSLQHTGGTDHESFNAIGIPAFQFIQDPLDYGTITHHSDMDTYAHAVGEDLMQASAVIASLVYNLANDPAFLPRSFEVRDSKLVQ